MNNRFYLSAVTGLTPSVQLYAGSVAYSSPITLTEIGSTGEYTAIMPIGIAAGYYLAVAMASPTNKIASSDVYWDGNQFVDEGLIGDVHKILGLDSLNPVTITPTTQDVDGIHIDIGGDGTTNTTLTRT